MGKSWRWWGGKEEAVSGKRRKERDGRVPETELEVIGGSAAYASGACAERTELPSSSIRDPLLLSLNPYVCHHIRCTCRPAHLFQPSHRSLFIVNNATHIVPSRTVRLMRISGYPTLSSISFGRRRESHWMRGWERRTIYKERMSSQCGAETSVV